MNKPKNYMEVVQWSVTWKLKHPHERFGQAFCNEFDIECQDLFYTEDKYEALSMIEEIISSEVGIENYYTV